MAYVVNLGTIPRRESIGAKMSESFTRALGASQKIAAEERMQKERNKLLREELRSKTMTQKLDKDKVDMANADRVLTQHSLKVMTMTPNERAIYEESEQYKAVKDIIKPILPDAIDKDTGMIISKRGEDIAKAGMAKMKNDALQAVARGTATDLQKQYLDTINKVDPDLIAKVMADVAGDVRFWKAPKDEVLREIQKRLNMISVLRGRRQPESQPDLGGDIGRKELLPNQGVNEEDPIDILRSGGL